MRASIWITLVALLLTGCATIAPPSIAPTQRTWPERQAELNRLNVWQITGKIGVQTAQDSGSANLNWTQNQQDYTLSLLGPLGAGGLKLSGRPGKVTLVMADGKVFTASSPEQLLAKQWGFNVPVSYLYYWIRGLPVPNLPANAQFDAYHRITELSQQQWHIQYLGYTTSAGVELPQKLTITSAQLKPKLIIYTWNTHIAH